MGSELLSGGISTGIYNNPRAGFLLLALFIEGSKYIITRVGLGNLPSVGYTAGGRLLYYNYVVLFDIYLV